MMEYIPYEPNKADWKLFRERLPEWQERYMSQLCDEYAAILTGEGRGSKAFWEIEDRIKLDKIHPGVMARMTKSDMSYIVRRLYRDKVITTDDLDGFSEELKKHAQVVI